MKPLIANHKNKFVVVFILLAGCNDTPANENSSASNVAALKQVSNEDLASEAMNSESAAKVDAIRELGTRGRRAQEHIRQVMAATDEEKVRAAAIEELGRTGDYNAMYDMIDALESPSPLVREKAFAAVHKMLGAGSYRPDAAPEEREADTAEIRARWQELIDGWSHANPDRSKWPILTGKVAPPDAAGKGQE